MFFPSFPGILGVQHREKVLAFRGGFPCFFQKSKERKIRALSVENKLFSKKGREAAPKKPLTRVSKRVPGVHRKRGLGRGWQKRLAERVGERLAKGWRRVGEGLGGFPPEAPV